MALVETIAGIFQTASTAIELKATVEEIREWLTKDASLESLLADLVEDKIAAHLPRLAHFCKNQNPVFSRDSFGVAVERLHISASRPEDIKAALLPVLTKQISMPGATCPESDYLPEIGLILDEALDGLWRQIAQHAELARETLLNQNVRTHTEQQNTGEAVQRIEAKLDAFLEFARSVWPQDFDPRSDKAPPREHRLERRTISNPFYLARAEDFNHNFEKLARLFQASPDWNSIQSRTENVILEGGRGTGKSMLLRRLTAQACLAAYRLQLEKATFDDVGQDFFGVYVKLTRGYYNQFETVDNLRPTAANLLAQHELNIEIFDAFVFTLIWLEENRAFPNIGSGTSALVQDLHQLFPKAPAANTLFDLHSVVVVFEQNEINNYVRDEAFGRGAEYKGSAVDTVAFVRRLSEIFRRRLFPEREIRLFLLIDEFETLLRVQQIAINTVIKMRLPDLTLKIGVRRSGCKTRDTFTAGDPIQDPRDYTAIALDYNVGKVEYLDLLRGIAVKRLEDAGFPRGTIETYLPKLDLLKEVTKDQLEQELLAIWRSGRRREQAANDEFNIKYTTAAVFRILNKTGRRKQFCGFEQYALLSSGVISNFIELCKYAFYHSLNDSKDLYEEPAISFSTQTRAAYEVSQRLFYTIDGNVPEVGEILKRLIADLGYILRQRLLNHPSEPEVITVRVKDYQQLDGPRHKQLADVLDAAVTWSVLQIKDEAQAFRPRNTERPPSIEFVINRIFCPALHLSPRARMRIEMGVGDLNKLIDSAHRQEMYKILVRKYGLVKENATLVLDLDESVVRKEEDAD